MSVVPSVAAVSDVLEVSSMKGFILILGVGIVAGVALAISDFYVAPRIAQLRMQAMAAAG